ncbi:MAG: hypothetical protein WC905_04510 [Patescibacteria group bacterium]|jgi:hypothetical protein
MFSYRSLLKQALTIAWKHKYLWVCGLFASLVASSGSWEYKILTENLNQNMAGGSYYKLNGFITVGEVIKNFFLGFKDMFQYDAVAVLNALTLILITAIILIIFVWLAITSQAALVSSVKKIASAKKKETTLSLRTEIAIGSRHFWPVLGLNLLTKILISVAFFIIGLPLLFLIIRDSGFAATLYTILFVIFIPVATGLGLMLKYAIAYKVLEDASFVKSIKKGWKLFMKNWLVSLEMAIILFLISLIASGLVLGILFLALMPLLLLGLIFNAVWLITFVTLIAIIVIVLIGSLLTTFQVATWTSLFLRLREKGAAAKLERLFGRRR